MLEAIAAKELRPFREGGGIALATLGLPFLWTESMGHGLLRVRILSGTVHVRKLLGAPVRGSFWSDRQLYVLEGLLSIVEQERVPDVDFVVSLLDSPICEFYGAMLPIFVFAKKADCPNILMPDHSLLHNGYQWGAGGSLFHWHAIVGRGLANPWASRISGGAYWDGGFGKGFRTKLLEVEHLLLQPERHPTADESLDRFNMNHYESPAVHCSYKLSLNAQGNTWSMRLKNIFMCRSAAVMSLPPVDQRYLEYWHAFLQQGTHFLVAHTDDTLRDITRVMAMSDSDLEVVAAAGFNYTAMLLRPKMIRRYMAVLLRQYAQLQLFKPAEAHAQDKVDFRLVTRAELNYVRTHATKLKSQNFHFHFPERTDLGYLRAASTGNKRRSSCRARELRAISLHNVPCWGTMHRFLHCCKARNSWTYSPGQTQDWAELHPFCRTPDLDPQMVWLQCCNRTTMRIETLFRNSIGKHAPAQLLDFLDRSILDLRLEFKEAYSLLELARDIALQRVMNDVRPNVALLGPDSSRPSSSEYGEHLREAWFFEETLQLTCTLNQVMSNLGAGPCGRSPVFGLLADLRSQRWEVVRRSQPLRIPRIAEPPPSPHLRRDWRSSPVGTQGAKSRPTSVVDVVLLVGKEPNHLALKSLLATRGCPLRLHLLPIVPPPQRRAALGLNARDSQQQQQQQEHEEPAAAAKEHEVEKTASGGSRAPGGISGSWVLDELAIRQVEDVDVVELPPFGVRALLTPYRWIPKNTSLLPVVDFSRPERGPLFLGDLCELHSPARNRPDAAIHAARHLEFARWMEVQWAADVMLMDMHRFKTRTTASILRAERKNALAAISPKDEVSAPHEYLATWLHLLQRHGRTVLQPLDYGWWFVPHEPWFYDANWNDILTLPWVPFVWSDALTLREYPGFDAASRTMKLYCPPAAHFMPHAVQYGWFRGIDEEVIRTRQLYANWWERYVQACDTPVFVLGLQWERAEKEPRIAFPVRGLPFVQTLIREYEAL